jgi:hypothetical protein
MLILLPVNTSKDDYCPVLSQEDPYNWNGLSCSIHASVRSDSPRSKKRVSLSLGITPLDQTAFSVYVSENLGLLGIRFIVARLIGRLTNLGRRQKKIGVGRANDSDVVSI